MRGIAAKLLFPIQNDSGEAIPPFSVVMVTSVITNADKSLTWSTVTKYDGSAGNIMVTGDTAIPATRKNPETGVIEAGRGSAAYDDFLYVAVDSAGPAAAGETWGPVSGQWTIGSSGTGFVSQGTTLSGASPLRGLFYRGVAPNEPEMTPYMITQDDGAGNPTFFARGIAGSAVTGRRLSITDVNPCVLSSSGTPSTPDTSICINSIQGFVVTREVVWTVAGGSDAGIPRRIAINGIGRQVFQGVVQSASIIPLGAGDVLIDTWADPSTVVNITVVARNRMPCTVHSGDVVTGVFTEDPFEIQFKITAAPCCCGEATTTTAAPTTTTGAPTTTTTAAPTTTGSPTTTAAPTTTTGAPTTSTAGPTTEAPTTGSPTTTTGSPTTTANPCSGNCSWIGVVDDGCGSPTGFTWSGNGNTCSGCSVPPCYPGSCSDLATYLGRWPSSTSDTISHACI